MARTLKSTPRRDGFRMPAEFEPHAGTWMLWPERPDNWRLGAKPAQEAFVAVASAIAAGEPVSVGVSAAQYENARQRLPSHVRVVEISSNDAWVRDTGPTCVVDARGRVRGVDWVFNAWGGLDGGLYFPWDEDDRVAYYSEGPERIFPRSPAIIGREVRNCHPPKSVHLVNQILDAFKSGSRDTAEFWIELGGKFVYIRYFAVRDAGGHYRGCLEVSQDLPEIRKLEGQNRLLDWE
jgi:hypothetical protein